MPNSDLISRDAAKKIVSLMVCAPTIKIAAEHEIDDLPAIDAAPERQGCVRVTLVYCKDCKKWEKDQPALDELTDTHTCGLHLIFTKPYDYCSYAEVKDNADGETPLPG